MILMNGKVESQSRKRQRRKIAATAIVVLLLGVGFAYLSTQLGIRGSASISNNNWNIYFDNIQISEGSVEATPPSLSTDKTTVNYTINLEKPGDYYEFLIDVVNGGTVDAKVDSVVKTELNENILKYLDYYVTYADDTEIKKNDALDAESESTYKVHIGYKDSLTQDDLLMDNLELRLSFSVNYVQANK